MTNESTQEPTVADLLQRIDQLEAKLIPPPKPDLNELLRDMVDKKLSRNRIDVMLDVRSIADKKEK